MLVDIAEKDLKTGILGLVVALVEIIKEALRLEAMRRMEAGSLTPRELERLGEALLELDAALARLKEELGIGEAVRAVRESLDRAVDDVLADFLRPALRDEAQMAGHASD